MFFPSKQVLCDQLHQRWMHLLPNSGWPCNPPSALHPRNTHLQPAAHGRSHLKQFISPQLLSLSWPLHPRRHEGGGGGHGGKIFSGKSGLGRGGYGVSRFKQQRWAQWSRNQAQVHAATATDTELWLWGLVRMQKHAGTTWHILMCATLIPPIPQTCTWRWKQQSRSAVQTGQCSHSLKYDISEKSWKRTPEPSRLLHLETKQ